MWDVKEISLIRPTEQIWLLNGESQCFSLCETQSGAEQDCYEINHEQGISIMN